MPANEVVTSSGSLAVGASQAIGLAASKPTLLFGYNLSGGTGATAISFLNGSGGTALWSDSIKAQSNAGDATVNLAPPYPIMFNKGLYVTITGAAGTAFVVYKDVV